MSTAQSDIYRLVPYRFFLDESKADICRLEQLTNLFPDMKPLIELEVFKINNLSRMIDRLSSIYTVVTAMHTRNDTMHIFLGPYHLSLGPTSFGAFQFKNISKVLLASANSKMSKDNDPQQQKRRHDAAFRRFRRAVRKLILIRSIIDQLRFASILTPYNQYELRTTGIYDLVLAGHAQNSHSGFDDDYFLEHSEETELEKESTLLMSRFIKINSLLTLLSPSPQQADKQTTTEQRASTLKLNGTNTKRISDAQSKSLMNLTTVCCPQHINDMPPVMLPKNQSASYHSIHLLTVDSHLKHHKRRSSHRTSSTISKTSSVDSLPDLTANDHAAENESKGSVAAHIPSHSTEEDAFVDRVSSLFKTYSISQQSPTHPDDNTIIPSSTDTSDQYEKLFQRIKAVVDHHISATTNHQQQQQQPMSERLVSFEDTATDKRSISSKKRPMKSHSIDRTDYSAFSSTELPSNINETEF